MYFLFCIAWQWTQHHKICRFNSLSSSSSSASEWYVQQHTKFSISICFFSSILMSFSLLCSLFTFHSLLLNSCSMFVLMLLRLFNLLLFYSYSLHVRIITALTMMNNGFNFSLSFLDHRFALSQYFLALPFKKCIHSFNWTSCECV